MKLTTVRHARREADYLPTARFRGFSKTIGRGQSRNGKRGGKRRLMPAKLPHAVKAHNEADQWYHDGKQDKADLVLECLGVVA